MTCRQARAAMHRALDGRSEAGPYLLGHLAGCARCARLHARLARSERAVRLLVDAPVPTADAARALASARARAASPPPRSAWRASVLAATGALLFAGGIALGHTAWPRERTVVRTEVVPEVVERVVEKPVEVRVPVIEYRDRIVTRTVRVLVPARERPEPTHAGPLAFVLRESPLGTAAMQAPIEIAPPIVSREVYPAAARQPGPSRGSDGASTGADATAPGHASELTLACVMNLSPHGSHRTEEDR